MVKFKLPIFHSCRSKHPSTLPDHPLPLYHQQQPHRSSFKSHVSSAFGCGSASKSGDFSDSDYFHWQEDDHWHVVAKIYDADSPRRKIYNSSVSGAATDTDDEDEVLPLPLLPLPPVDKKKRRRSRRMKVNKLRNPSHSSGDSLLFSSEYSIDERAEDLLEPSRSFSTDSSTDFNPQLETIRESAPILHSKPYKLRKKRTALLKRNTELRRGSGESSEYGSPARLSVFSKLIPCKVEGKMKESFAMLKRSSDPYDDFRRSMMEMIVEKEMFEECDLEKLLQCYLSLNSRFHHGVIVEAFTEIWDTMFGAGGGHH